MGGNQRKVVHPAPPPPASAPHSVQGTDSQPSSDHDSGNEAGSEADVESNSGFESGGGERGVTDSWVSLHDQHHHGEVPS